MIQRELVLSVLLVAACSIDEGASGDGGADGAPDVTTDVVGKDVATNTCDAGTACGVANDCPATATACITRTCADGCCGTVFAATGVSCTEDGGHVCNGAGQCVVCNSGNDCPKTPTVCQTAGCTNNACTNTNAATGTPCTEDGGKVCDGTGACVACNQPSDCPAQTTLCMTNACNNNACATTPAATGTTCNNDGGKVCDGTGICVQCNLANDCPATSTTCQQRSCSNNACATTPAATGTPCIDNGGHVCDGTGACVQCNIDTDCLAINDAGVLVCVGNQCQ